VIRLADVLRLLRGRKIKHIPVETPVSTPRHQLAIFCIVRDEASNLAEWIDFHAAQGVGHFYIYDNDSSDGTAEVLAPYLLAGRITVLPWKHRIGYHTQACAYAHALTSFGQHCRWMGFIDVDEFMYCPDGRKLTELLEQFTQYPALIVHRHTYGTSGHLTPPGGVIGQFSLRVPAPDGPFLMKGNLAPKSVVQPSRVAAVNGAHTFQLKGTPAIGHDETGEALFGRQAPGFRDRLIRIDHFYTKDRQTFLRRTRRRTASNVVYPASRWIAKLNAVEQRAVVHDKQILRVLPTALRKQDEGDAQLASSMINAAE